MAVLSPTLTIGWAFAAVVALMRPAEFVWRPQTSGATARFRGLCVVNETTAWASGTDGTFARTTDGGKTWKSDRVPGAADLDFRDVEAFDGETALLLSSGPGAASRVYRTTDGGAHWVLRFTNPEPKGFLDAIAFSDADHGMIVGDPVGGLFRVFLTDDGGRSWHYSPVFGMPTALEGEGAFAASGTCLVGLRGSSLFWFGTGGARVSRVFRTENGGRTWAVAVTPVAATTPSAGVFSLAFRDARHGLAIGGDYKKDGDDPALARTIDGGQSWVPIKTGPRGYRSGLSLAGKGVVVAVGPGGTDLSTDDGATWTFLGPTGYHAVGMATPTTGWAVGDGGRVGRLSVSGP